MKRSTFAKIALVLGLALACMGCVGTQTFRYRITLEVETPEGVKTGSGVLEAIYTDQAAFSGLANGKNWYMSTRGEAISVDLGARGILFMTFARDFDRLHVQEMSWLVPNVFRQPYFPGGVAKSREGARQFKAIVAARAQRDFPIAWLPMLVRFDSLSDPTSARRVDPSDLAGAFGEGVRLKRASVQVVAPDEPLTEDIGTKLPWLSTHQGQLLYWTGASRDAPIPARLNPDDFRLQMEKPAREPSKKMDERSRIERWKRQTFGGR